MTWSDLQLLSTLWRNFYELNITNFLMDRFHLLCLVHTPTKLALVETHTHTIFLREKILKNLSLFLQCNVWFCRLVSSFKIAASFSRKKGAEKRNIERFDEKFREIYLFTNNRSVNWFHEFFFKCSSPVWDLFASVLNIRGIWLREFYWQVFVLALFWLVLDHFQPGFVMFLYLP